jgi:hydrogenase maturation protease
VLGIGNKYRRDDGVGLWIASQLQAAGCPAVIRSASGEGADLMALWQGYERVVVVDAVQAGDTAGTIYQFKAHQETIPSRFFNYSTHAFSLAEAVELARVLGELPPQLWVFGIEGGDFSAGEGFTPAVSQAAGEVIHQIQHLLQS